MKISLTKNIIQFKNESLKIPQAHLKSVCKIHTDKACRYIGGLVKSDSDNLKDYVYVCAKHTDSAKILDDAVKSGILKATGNNCDGFK